MTTHTPGPWSCDYGDSAVFCDTGAEIASVTHGNHDDGTAIGCAETICNLKLIAAAPELLEALRGLMNCHTGAAWQTADAQRRWWMAADAAVAKATGRP